LLLHLKQFRPGKVKSSATPLIPKVIHQIWLGENKMPQNFQYYLETWRKFHPDWIIKVWSEEELIAENFPSIDLYYLAGTYQERASIMAYELIKRYGGLYLDNDIECLANFDELHHKYDFYSSIEPPMNTGNETIYICNGMFAAAKNHPILDQVMDKIRQRWKAVEEEWEHKYAIGGNNFERSRHWLAVRREMYTFGEAIFDFLQKEESQTYKSIILPSGFGYPLYYVNNRPVANFFRKAFNLQPKLDYEIKMQPETMSYHHYDKDNSLVKSVGFIDSLGGLSYINKKIFKHSKKEDKYYLAFKDLFDKYYPNKIAYKSLAQIKEAIYLENSSKMSEQEIRELKDKWQKLNPFFVIKVLNDSELNDLIPIKMKDLDSKTINLLARFYLLYRNGGVYLDSEMKPLSLQEFNYKYGYYSQYIEIKNAKDILKPDLGFIASKKNHEILTHFLSDVENKFSSNLNITVDEIEEIYLKNIFKYNQLDGYTIIFPINVLNQKR
jgi:mannosyltransferase OCH1-like enzyme